MLRLGKVGRSRKRKPRSQFKKKKFDTGQRLDSEAASLVVTHVTPSTTTGLDSPASDRLLSMELNYTPEVIPEFVKEVAAGTPMEDSFSSNGSFQREVFTTPLRQLSQVQLEVLLKAYFENEDMELDS